MKNVILVLVVLFVIAILFERFYHKKDISFELIYRVKNIEEDFRPIGYEFFHTHQELNSYFERNQDTKELQKKLSDVVFDFDKYSYGVFYGREVASMFHSYKSTYLDDITPTYARTKGKIPVFVTYKDTLPGTEASSFTYIYRLEKDCRLRGFYD